MSNPVDIISHYVKKLSGLPKNQVIGTGTAIDSARLKTFIGELVKVDPRSVHAYSMGEHGDSQMVPWSVVTVAGKPFYDVIADNRSLVGDVDLDELVHKTTREGWEILERVFRPFLTDMEHTMCLKSTCLLASLQDSKIPQEL